MNQLLSYLILTIESMNLLAKNLYLHSEEEEEDTHVRISSHSVICPWIEAVALCERATLPPPADSFKNFLLLIFIVVKKQGFLP